MDPVSIINIANGLMGLFGRRANPAETAAATAIRNKDAFAQQLRALAAGYDPAAETQRSVAAGSDAASRALSNALSGLNARYSALGGAPSGDTRFSVAAQGAADRVLDPLKTFAANRAASEFASKLNAMAVANGADPGSIAPQYMALAQSARTDPSGAVGSLAAGLRSLFAGASRVSDPFGANSSPTGAGIGGAVGSAVNDPGFNIYEPSLSYGVSRFSGL